MQFIIQKFLQIVDFFKAIESNEIAWLLC